MIALIGARVFDGERLLDGYAVVIDGANIAAVVVDSALPAGVRTRRIDGLIAPGFIDVQVNGGGGVLFNDDRSVDGIAAIGAAHRRFGTTGFLPTFITDTREKMAEAIAAARAAIAANVPGVLGMHIEGPFLSPQKPGVHRAEYVRPIEAADVALVAAPIGGVMMMTLAPEEVPVATIAALAKAGVVLSAGHTVATVEIVAAARAAGLTGFTHLYNAMPPLSGREPGVLGAALDDPEAWASIIVDMQHVSALALRVALAARGWERTMLITDAMPTVGADISEFVLTGTPITLRDGRLTAPGGGIGGAHLDMATAVRNTVTELGLSLEAALHMASRAPAGFLGLADRYGRVAPGYRASLVALDDDLRVTETWIDGVAT